MITTLCEKVYGDDEEQLIDLHDVQVRRCAICFTEMAKCMCYVILLSCVLLWSLQLWLQYICRVFCNALKTITNKYNEKSRWPTGKMTNVHCSTFSFIMKRILSHCTLRFGILVQRVGIPSEEVIWQTSWHRRLWSSCNWPQRHAASSVLFPVQVFRAMLWGITETASTAVC